MEKLDYEQIIDIASRRTKGEWVTTGWENSEIKIGDKGYVYNKGGFTVDDASLIAALPQIIDVLVALNTGNLSMRHQIELHESKMADTIRRCSDVASSLDKVLTFIKRQPLRGCDAGMMVKQGDRALGDYEVVAAQTIMERK